MGTTSDKMEDTDDREAAGGYSMQGQGHITQGQGHISHFVPPEKKKEKQVEFNRSTIEMNRDGRCGYGSCHGRCGCLVTWWQKVWLSCYLVTEGVAVLLPGDRRCGCLVTWWQKVWLSCYLVTEGVAVLLPGDRRCGCLVTWWQKVWLSCYLVTEGVVVLLPGDRRCGCLVTWFCYHLIAKLGNKTAAPSWPDPYGLGS